MRPIDIPNYDHMLGFKFPNKKIKDASIHVHSLRAFGGGYFDSQKYTFMGAIYEVSRKHGVSEKDLKEWVHKHEMHNNERCNLRFGCIWYELIVSKKKRLIKREEQLTMF